MIAFISLGVRGYLIKRQANAICEASPIGSTFDRSEFSKRAKADGFRPVDFERSPESQAMAVKTVLSFFRGSCTVDFRDGVVTDTTVAMLD